MSRRTDQVGSEVRNILSAALLREIELPDGVVVSVHRVNVASDLRDATAWITIHPSDQEEQVFFILKKALPELRRAIGERLTARLTPKVLLRIDRSQAKADRINEILDKLSAR